MKDNNINIKVIETDKFKTVCLAILIKQPLDRQNVTYNALIPKLLVMGSENYKTVRAINKKIEEIGCYLHSDILKKGDYQIIELMVEFVNKENRLDEVFSFLSEIILKPLTIDNGFCKENLEKSKAILLESIKARENDKKDFAKNRCVEIMCKDEPFGIMADGYSEDLEKDICPKELYEHYTSLLKTNQIDIMAIGDIKKEDIEALTKQKIQIADRCYKENEIGFIKKEKKDTEYVEEDRNVTQGKLCMAYRGNIEPDTKEFVAFMVGNQIFGGSAGSMLFNNIREKESLCYYVNSFIFMFKGIMFVQSGIEFKSYKDVLNKVCENFENLKKGDFSDEDIVMAKEFLCKRYLGMQDNNTSCLDYYYTSYLAKMNKDINQMIDEIKNVKKDEILKVFENVWLDTCYFMKGDEIDR